MRALFALLLLGACGAPVGVGDNAQDGAAVADAGAAGNASADTGADPAGADKVATADDGLGAPVEAYVARVKGKFQLWQNDRGDDGLACEVELLGSRTIGGYGVAADAACLRTIGIEDLSAWFVAESDGQLVLIDATRRPVMRLKRAQDGYYYFGNDEFYLSRPGSEE